jgi:hypothetical protein
MDTPAIGGIGGFPNEAMVEYVLGLARGPRLLRAGTARREEPLETRLL